jgi:dienelactone hydrolase
MRRVLVVVALLLASCGSPATPTSAPTSAAPGPAEAVAGEWHGRIEIPGSHLVVAIRLMPEGDGLGGEIDMLAGGVSGMPLDDVLLEATDLSFRLPELDARFRGTVASDGASVQGSFIGSDQPFPLVLIRGAGPGRPPESQPPFPYRAEEVTYRGEGIDIAGTLTLPEGPGPFTAVLLLADIGPEDLKLADMLTGAGYAVLRVDERGIGGTGGNYRESTFEERTADAVAGVEYLRGRPDIAPAQIGLLGHAEAGSLAPLAAHDTDVAFAVLMAVSAVTGEDQQIVLGRQTLEASGSSPEEIDRQTAYIRELVRLLRAEDYAAARSLAAQQIQVLSADLPAEERPTPEEVETQVETQVTPSFRSYLLHDPAPSLRALDVPVLALYGDSDVVVPPAQSETTMRALLAGNPDATVQTLPGIDRHMRRADPEQVGDWATRKAAMDPLVLDLIREWLAQRFPA